MKKNFKKLRLWGNRKRQSSTPGDQQSEKTVSSSVTICQDRYPPENPFADPVAGEQYSERVLSHSDRGHRTPSTISNPFADPVAPIPAHLSPRSNSPYKPYLHPNPSLRSQDGWTSSIPGTPMSSRSSLHGLVEGKAATHEDANKGLLSESTQPRKGRFTRIKEKIHSQVDLRSIIHLFDFRPWFWPITLKKYVVLFLVASAIVGIVISNIYFNWIAKSLAITRRYMLPVLIISVCAEPLIILVVLLIAKIPDIPKEEIAMIMDKEDADVEKALKEPQGPFETALIIPCHNTEEAAIKVTLDSAFPSFRPQDIFIVDNGRSRHPTHPTCNFRAYIRSIHPDIVYIWSPIGSKNAAQLVGALAARNYKYIMTVDDDVCIPKNFSPPTEMIDDKFKAVVYPLKGINAAGNTPLFLVAWQDVEYRLSGLSKLAEDRLCGVQYPHGAGWFVERETFVTLMEYHHPMDFIAEDCNAGLGLSKMGKGMRCDARSYLATEVPGTFLGPGLNWWKQRQKSWEMGRHGRVFAFIKQLLFVLPVRKTPQGILWHKVTYFYCICANLIDWLRIPTFIALGGTATWWRNAILLMLFSAIPPLIYKYIRCRRRPDLQPRFWACLTYPWYKQLYAVVAILGAVRCIGYYFGGHQRPLNIQQMLKKDRGHCVWLDPRFETNPAWLADEGEALARQRQQQAEHNEKTSINNNTPDNNPHNHNTIIESALNPPLATYQQPARLIPSSAADDDDIDEITPAPLIRPHSSRSSSYHSIPLPSTNPTPGMTRACTPTMTSSGPVTPNSGSRANSRPQTGARYGSGRAMEVRNSDELTGYDGVVAGEASSKDARPALVGCGPSKAWPLGPDMR
ncbi:hypothetical protein AJ80_00749 [Polytolypa hystricis UAMH7299]|uniref:Glycosyltransferase 2-like domain-containing protein n=1 Tax=Polytolypa hystricis (strain UAMH7299) TaxID=1447883 RepID=A0A2B7Z306_POLH7|nr:hypothetical protein AJ80_00749 [Polytolypa hystricis UAMH7299]